MLIIKLSILIDICALGIEVRELAHKGCIAVVSGLLQGSGFDLTNNANFVAGSDKSFGMYW